MDWFRKSPANDQDAVLAATKAFIKGITKLPDVTCKVVRIEGSFAKVGASSATGTVAPISGYARKKDGKWEVLAMGSFFDQEFFKKHGIPASLWKA